ncbi:MAG: hypothetical protein D4R80_02605 [Deltaproteobacteria bacterium]|nr:MAG: hypothetical protein D4R80_02605 [Deltaproteobacteria bacterium]
MRVFLYSAIGIPLLIADAVLLWTLPVRMANLLTMTQGLILLSGTLAYPCLHFLLRKPERMYLWGHEFTHLLVAKLFLRHVHGFHITSRSGGKVVIDRTNVAIDLAPYALPFYNIVALLPMALIPGEGPYARKIYLGAAAFLFSMHLSFSAEGFIEGQPDVRRSGRIFSLAVVLLLLMLWTPILAAPGTHGGFSGLPVFYREWIHNGMKAVFSLSEFVRSLLGRRFL